MTTAGKPGEARPRWAVIDIGSNSVRLVMYEGPARSPLTVFNEKVLCGLGQREPKTGALREEAMSEALGVLRRFAEIIEHVHPHRIDCFATAAARDAPNGSAFLKKVAALGLKPRLLPGDEEARLAALGILSGAPEILDIPEGALAGDIGGGSLELCHLNRDAEGFLGPRVSLPLGALRLCTEHEGDLAAARKVIDKTLRSVRWLKKIECRSFYVVGGAWRALARIAKDHQDYPIDILDHYTLSRGIMSDLCDWLITQPVSELEEMPSVQRRRAPTLPYAALVMNALLERLPIEQVVMSANGVREGSLFSRLSPEQQLMDPLYVLADYVAAHGRGHLRPDPDVLFEFLSPLIPDRTPAEERIWRTAARLCNVATLYHPDEKPEQAARLMMAVPFRGLSHQGRVMLAAAFHFRHTSSPLGLSTVVPAQVISDTELQTARVIGQAMRFAAALDPSGHGALPVSRLVVGDDTLELVLPEEVKDFWGPGPAKRFERLAQAMEKQPVI